MPEYRCYVSNGEDKLLLEYGKILQERGLIKNLSRYAICKFILKAAIEGLKGGVEIGGNKRGKIGVRS